MIGLLSSYGSIIILCVAGWLLGACSNSSSLNLLRAPGTTMLIDAKGVYQTPPETGAAWQKFDRGALDAIPFDSATRVWFSFPLERSAGTHLFINACKNIASLYQDQTLIKRDLEGRTYPYMPDLFLGDPILPLPENPPQSRLYLQVVYSGKSGFCYDCFQLSISSRYEAMRSLLESAAPELFATFVAFFLGLLSLFLTISRRQKMITYFSLFVFTMAGLYFNENLIVRMVLAHAVNWDALAYFALMAAPIVFLLFFEEVLSPPFQLAKRIAWLDLSIFIVELVTFVAMPEMNIALHRRYYFIFLLVEFAFIPPLCIIGIIQRKPFAKSFGFGAILVVGAASCDVWADLFAVSKPIVLMPFALIAFITLLLGIITSLATREDATIEKEKLRLAQERTQNLMNLVTRRTADLDQNSEKLASLNQELSDKHEFFLVQAQKVSEYAEEKDRLLQQIHRIRESSLPQILASLQKLHRSPDDAVKKAIDQESSLIQQVFEVVARLYAMRQHLLDRRILIFDAEKKNQRFYKLALGGSKLELILVGTHEEFSAQLDRHSFELIGIHEQQVAALALTQTKQPEASIIIFHESQLLEDHIPLVHPAGVHYLALNLPRTLLQKLLLTHVTKLVTREIFGLEKYLNWGSMVKEAGVASRDQQLHVLERMRAQLESLGLMPEHLAQMVRAAHNLLDIQAKGLLADHGGIKHTSQTILRYGYDASFHMVSISIQGRLGAQVQKLFQTSDPSPPIAELLHTADCLILNSDSQLRHEILAIMQSDKINEKTELASFHTFTLSRDLVASLQSA